MVCFSKLSEVHDRLPVPRCSAACGYD